MFRKLGLGTAAGGALVALVGGVVALACTSIAAVDNLSPGSGPIGSHVTMNFSGFNSMNSHMENATTNIYFGGQAHGVLVASAPTGENFSVTFTVPSGYAPGNYVVEAVSTGYNASTGQRSQETARAVFDVTPGVPQSGATSSNSTGLVQLNGSAGGPNQQQTIVIDQGVARPGTAVGNRGGTVPLQQLPVAPGQSVSLASSGLGSMAGVVLLFLGVAVLATGVATVGAVGLSRVLQPRREAERVGERI
ncbi:MAG: hypothetical protein ACYDAC_12800 [Candidatus Dormibacteria bacterium]